MKTGILLLIGVWIGLVLGLSFIEAPLKFQAPGITTNLGLGIGKLVFSMSNRIQLGFLVIVSLSLVLNLMTPNWKYLPFFLLVMLIMLIQTFYLLPALDDRANLRISGQIVESTYHHLTFVGLEILKLISLTFLYIKLSKHA